MTAREIDELSKFSSLPFQEIAELTPERLALHDILIRVMAELTIDDGPLQSDLGSNFRKIVGVILDRHFRSEMPAISEAFQRLRREIVELVSEEVSPLDRTMRQSPPPPRRPVAWLSRLVRWTPSDSQHGEAAEAPCNALDLLERWKINSAADHTGTSLIQSINGALFKAGSAIVSQQGHLQGRHVPLGRLAVAMTCNTYGAQFISGLVEPCFNEAVSIEGFRRLPSQDRPVVMNTKGASAAGKSTLRPKQRELAQRIGVAWEDFALISPDIWRKQLLDYGTLGDDYRWAGSLTGHEVEIIDSKLDRYVARRAAMGIRTHLLIDRFRFDSFAPEDAEDGATQLLTRFGSEVYMFFMITPPEATVERAWLRGERVGRYKAVDDLLAHNVEAYSGMPGLFFRWLASPDKRVHYEFLDNSVEEGHTPRTLAFGWNQEINIVDVDGLVDIDRFKAINVDAKCSRQVYSSSPQADVARLEFLKNCIKLVPRVLFAEHSSGKIFAEFANGEVVDWDGDLMLRAVNNGSVRSYLIDRAGVSQIGDASQCGETRHIAADRYRTLGDWGSKLR